MSTSWEHRYVLRGSGDQKHNREPRTKVIQRFSMTTSNKRTGRGFLLSVSMLSAASLLAALPLSVSAQTEDTVRDNAAAETSPANPTNDAQMMLDADGNIIDASPEDTTGVTRDNAAAETSPANPTNDEMMTGEMEDGGSVVNVESENTTGVTRDNAAAETSPANPTNDGMMTDEMDDDVMMGDSDDDTDVTTSNSPRALW